MKKHLALLKRLSVKNVYTPIRWYAGFPNHDDGDGSKAPKAPGKLTAEHVASTLARVLKMAKEDRKTLAFQKEFYDRVETK